MECWLVPALHLVLALQTPEAAVTGTVRDEVTGVALAGAVVTLTELDRGSVTDAAGRYLLRDVPAGPHHLAVRFIGYAPRAFHALVPSEGVLRLEIALAPVPLRLPTVEARTPIPVRGAERGEGTPYPDRGASIAAVRNHPLLAEADLFQAIGGGEVVVMPEAPSGIHVRGGASDQITYLLDDLPVLNPYHAAGLFAGWNPDAIAHIGLSASAPSPAYPGALSGAVVATTRAPGTRLRTQGAVSSTQGRATVDGPLGVAGAGFLLSVRSGFPDLLAPSEPSYLRGQSGDRLAKLEAPAFGGRLRLLAYELENELDVAGIAETEQSPGPVPRNEVEWESRSLGAHWRRPFRAGTLRLLAWSAAGDASAEWAPGNARLHLSSSRRDEGLVAAVERSDGRVATTAGLRVDWSRTSYQVGAASTDGPAWSVAARTPVVSVFAEHLRPLADGLELQVAGSLGHTRGRIRVGPRGRLSWRATETVTLSATGARLHQFAQSLRNAESVVGTIFPADLFVGAGAPGVPIARTDQGIIAADWRPDAGVRVAVQAYARGLDGLVLTAPREGEPFATGGFEVGSSTARGVVVEAAVSRARYGLVASYGLQRVRLSYLDRRYVPAHAATHRLEGGLTLFPSASFSLRLGAAAAFGRRTTVASGLEWESCNLLDEGCEFAGSPSYHGAALGGAELPTYLRVDLGVRKHWHLELGGRDVTLALFGTVTNLLNRRNVMTYAAAPGAGPPVEVEMRPLAPLVVGLEWGF